jgi:hypothetical protein
MCNSDIVHADEDAVNHPQLFWMQESIPVVFSLAQPFRAGEAQQRKGDFRAFRPSALRHAQGAEAPKAEGLKPPKSVLLCSASPSPKGLCNVIRQNVKLVNMGSYLTSPNSHFSELRCKAALKGWANEKNNTTRIEARILVFDADVYHYKRALLREPWGLVRSPLGGRRSKRP